MIAQNLAYVALASRDPGLTCAVLEQHLQLPRSEFEAGRERVPVFAVGRSALAVFPLAHPLLDGDATPGLHHIALEADDLRRAAHHAAEAGLSPGPAGVGLGGRESVVLDRAATAGVRVRLTHGLGLAAHCGERVERIDHLGVASTDVAQDERVFTGCLGFQLESRQTDMEVSIAVESFTSDKYGVVYHTRAPEPVGGLRVTFITVGDCELEFLANFDPSQGARPDHGTPGSTRQDHGAITRYVQSRGCGLHHVALKVRDIDATLGALAAAGLRLIDTRGRPGSRRARIGFVHPAAFGGILMHLVQRDG